jgi:hypothetical protein
MILIKRGTNAARTGYTPQTGELFWATDTKLLYCGDGATAGGNLVGSVTGSTAPSANYSAGARPIVNSAGTTAIAPGSGISPYEALFQIQAGSGTYTANFTLSRANAVLGYKINVLFQISASTNQTIRVYDNTTGGTLLDTFAGDGTARTIVAQYLYTGAAWDKTISAYQL